jgi:hypothetical protein
MLHVMTLVRGVREGCTCVQMHVYGVGYYAMWIWIPLSF